MRIKLDENLGDRCADLFRKAGHNVATVAGQGLASASDAEPIEVCRVEERCLVTLDLGFANPLLFPPSTYSGIAVMRGSGQIGLQQLEERARTLVAAFAQSEIAGTLWIVEVGRIREYLPEHDPPEDIGDA